MAKLSGKVAVLNAAENAVVEIRDLGPNPVDVKGTRARPFEEIQPALGANEYYTGSSDSIQATKVVRTWVKAAHDYPTEDTATLNAALLVDGSVLRAITTLTFKEINKLRVKTGDPAYTMAQFLAALKVEMRT